MTRLFICEKPSQARDIGKVLGATRKGEGSISGNGVVVTWGFGHLLEQAPPEAYDPNLKKWSFDTLPIVPSQWKMQVKKESSKQFNIIQKLLKDAAEVVISTDSDREGETIGREILEACKYKGPVKRLWLSALDDASIRKALADIRPGEKTWPLYQAGLGRSQADWIVGMNMTRAFSILASKEGYRGVLSVGRVQSPTLKLVVDRDAEIANFVSRPFWELEATLQAHNGVFKAKWKPQREDWLDDSGRCINQQAAQEVAARARSGQAVVTSVELSRKKEAQPLVMDLGTLQQECSKRWGYGAKEVLDIAQSLYETHKAQTYPRTDCRYLPAAQLAEVPAVLDALLHTDSRLEPVIKRLDPSLKSRVWNDSKITAHHGIIPTTAPANMERMSDRERNVYDLVRRHYLAQFLPVHEYDQTDVVLDLSGERFDASGRRIQVEGWKILFPRGKGKTDGNEDEEKGASAQELPSLSERETCQVQGVEVLAKKTTPPSPYTEGTLIAAMKNAARFVTDEKLKARLRETAGIGTEATRASIIETLLQRQFIQKKGRSVVSTPIGQALIGALPSQLSNPGMTAMWEQALDMIAEGSLSLDDFMSRQRVMLDKLIQRSLQVTTLNLPKQPTETCPLCQGEMHRVRGPKGDFWSCNRYPNCKGTKNIEGKGKGTRKPRASTTRRRKSS